MSVGHEWFVVNFDYFCVSFVFWRIFYYYYYIFWDPYTNVFGELILLFQPGKTAVTRLPEDPVSTPREQQPHRSRLIIARCCRRRSVRRQFSEGRKPKSAIGVKGVQDRFFWPNDIVPRDDSLTACHCALCRETVGWGMSSSISHGTPNAKRDRAISDFVSIWNILKVCTQHYMLFAFFSSLINSSTLPPKETLNNIFYLDCLLLVSYYNCFGTIVLIFISVADQC